MMLYNFNPTTLKIPEGTSAENRPLFDTIIDSYKDVQFIVNLFPTQRSGVINPTKKNKYKHIMQRTRRSVTLKKLFILGMKVLSPQLLNRDNRFVLKLDNSRNQFSNKFSKINTTIISQFNNLTRILIDRDITSQDLVLAKQKLTTQVKNFRRILHNVMNLLTSLTNQKLPFRFYDSTYLQTQFSNFVTNVRNQNYQLQNPDFMSIYTAKTYSYVHAEKPYTLALVTILPISKGEILNIYQYISTPLYFSSDLSISITATPYQYFAMNKIGTLIQQYTPAQFQACNAIGSVYDCKTKQILLKQKHQSCLYNLFHHNFEQIKQTCTINFNAAAFQAQSVALNSFQLYSPFPTKLFVHCENIIPIDFQDTYLFQLNSTCPEAYTDSHMFVYTKQNDTDNLLRIPLYTNLTDLFDVPPSEISDMVKSHDLLHHTPINYLQIQNQLNHIYTSLLQQIKDVAQDVALLIVLVSTVAYIFMFLKRFSCKCFCSKTKQNDVHMPLKPILASNVPIHHTPLHLQQALIAPA